MQDPFFAVKEEVEHSVTVVIDLHKRWQELSSAGKKGSSKIKGAFSILQLFLSLCLNITNAVPNAVRLLIVVVAVAFVCQIHKKILLIDAVL